MNHFAVWTAIGLYGFGIVYDTVVSPGDGGDHLAPVAVSFGSSASVSVNAASIVSYTVNAITGDEVAMTSLACGTYSQTPALSSRKT